MDRNFFKQPYIAFAETLRFFTFSETNPACNESKWGLFILGELFVFLSFFSRLILFFFLPDRATHFHKIEGDEKRNIFLQWPNHETKNLWRPQFPEVSRASRTKHNYLPRKGNNFPNVLHLSFQVERGTSIFAKRQNCVLNSEPRGLNIEWKILRPARNRQHAGLVRRRIKADDVSVSNKCCRKTRKLTYSHKRPWRRSLVLLLREAANKDR